MTKTRRSFTGEFKREAVKLVKQPGAKITHIARDLGIEQSVLRRWVDQERGGVLEMRPSRPIRRRRLAKSSGYSVNCAESRWSATSKKKRSATLPRLRSEVRLYYQAS